MVRPANAEVSFQTGSRGEKIAEGRYLIEGPAEIAISRAGWGSEKLSLKAHQHGMAVHRLEPPNATISAKTRSGKPVKFKLLPEKQSLSPSPPRGFQLRPGTNKLLAEADGHIPAVFTLTLAAAEKKSWTVDLKPIPRLPDAPASVTPRPSSPKPWTPPPAFPTQYPSSRPAASHSRPSTAPPPPPAPIPRFTPVAPPPARPADPEPVFTPLP